MSRPDNATHIIQAFKQGQVLIETWHIGDASRDMELSVYKDRMRRGEIDYVVVTNLEPPYGCYKVYG